jgi:hypothetical protein
MVASKLSFFIDRARLDQDRVDLCLDETKPPMPHQIGRRDVAYSKAFWDECNRLEGLREADLKRLLKQVDDTGSWGGSFIPLPS